MNRKKFIAALSLASTAHLSSASGQRFIKRQQPSSKRSKLGSSGFRLAHVTDPHISSRNNAPEKIAAAFRHIHDQKKISNRNLEWWRFNNGCIERIQEKHKSNGDYGMTSLTQKLIYPYTPA